MSNELEHYGVLGMRWGHHKSLGVTRRQYKTAEKDARESARAKMFYGEGAGTRRKLIKNTVETRSKDPGYKTAYDYHSGQQDMSRHVQAAKGERRRKDAVNTTAKTVRGVKNTLLGNPQYATAGAILLATAGTAAYKAGYHKVVAKYGAQAFNGIKVTVRAQQIMNQFRKTGGF